MLYAMGGPLRNKQWLRIAVVLSVLLLVVYLFMSVRSNAQLGEEKLAVAMQNHRNLLDKFNKLTDELKRNCFYHDSMHFRECSIYRWCNSSTTCTVQINATL